MNMVALSIAILIIAAMVTIGLLACIVRAKWHEAYYRAQLKRRLNNLRLSKMIAYVGADVDEYIRNVPIDEIEAALHRCEQCTATETCDLCLHGKLINNMHFCPNYSALTEHSKVLTAKH